MDFTGLYLTTGEQIYEHSLVLTSRKQYSHTLTANSLQIFEAFRFLLQLVLQIHMEQLPVPSFNQLKDIIEETLLLECYDRSDFSEG